MTRVQRFSSEYKYLPLVGFDPATCSFAVSVIVVDRLNIYYCKFAVHWQYGIVCGFVTTTLRFMCLYQSNNAKRYYTHIVRARTRPVYLSTNFFMYNKLTDTSIEPLNYASIFVATFSSAPTLSYHSIDI